jgi:hypothetical protein
MGALSPLVKKMMRAQVMRTLTARCSIKREVLETDRYGAPTARLVLVAGDVPCRLMRPGGSRSEGAAQTVGAQETMPESYRLVVPDTVEMQADELVELDGRAYRVVRAVDGWTDELFRAYVVVMRRGDGGE